jgi:hypothetical protein
MIQPRQQQNQSDRTAAGIQFGCSAGGFCYALLSPMTSTTSRVPSCKAVAEPDFKMGRRFGEVFE